MHNAGQRLEVLVDGDYVFLDNMPHMMLMIRDVTLPKEHQARLAYLAYHDPLTDLPNSRMFYERMDVAIRESRRRGQQMAIILVHLQRFREINERYGYDTGDEALRQAALVIKESVGSLVTAASSCCCSSGCPPSPMWRRRCVDRSLYASDAAAIEN